MPGRSWTTARSSPIRRLNSVDLPTLGRPTTATAGTSGRTGSPPPPSASSASMGWRLSSGNRATTSSSRSPVRRPCRALTGQGSPMPRASSSQLSASRRSLSALLATSSTSLAVRRSHSATSASSSVTPTEASTTSSTTSAATHGLLDLAAHLGLEVGAAGQPTAGVDHRERDAQPVGLQLLAVPRHAGLVLDDHHLACRRCGSPACSCRRWAVRRPRRPRAPRSCRARFEGPAQGDPVGGEDLDGPGQIGQREAVEEATLGEADVGQQVAVAFGLVGQDPGEVGARPAGRSPRWCRRRTRCAPG